VGRRSIFDAGDQSGLFSFFEGVFGPCGEKSSPTPSATKKGATRKKGEGKISPIAWFLLGRVQSAGGVGGVLFLVFEIF
jgi:hypothetical protein